MSNEVAKDSPLDSMRKRHSYVAHTLSKGKVTGSFSHVDVILGSAERELSELEVDEDLRDNVRNIREALRLAQEMQVDELGLLQSQAGTRHINMEGAVRNLDIVNGRVQMLAVAALALAISGAYAAVRVFEVGEQTQEAPISAPSR